MKTSVFAHIVDLDEFPTVKTRIGMSPLRSENPRPLRSSFRSGFPGSKNSIPWANIPYPGRLGCKSMLSAL